MNGGLIGKNNRPTSTAASGVWGLNDLYHAKLTRDWPSDLQVKVGSFVKPTAVGTQAITGVGFTPKAIIFFTTGSTAAAGSTSAHMFSCLGFTAGASNSYAVGCFSVQGPTPTDTARRMAAVALVSVTSATAIKYEAALQSFDSDGFTLNWTTVASADTETISYVALGGANLQAKVVNWTSPTSTGNKAVTGAGFQPDIVLHTSAFTTSVPQSSANLNFCMGAMNSAGEQWMATIVSLDNFGTSATSRGQLTDACFGYIDTSEVFEVKASYMSADADGFTLNFSAVDAQPYQSASLCLKGVTTKIGSFNKSTGAAPAVQPITAPGFQPDTVFMASYNTVTSATGQSQAYLSMGAGDRSSNGRAAVSIDVDAANPNSSVVSIFDTKAIRLAQANGTSPSAATHAMTATGFDLTWNPNNTSQADQVLYLVMK